MVSDLFNELILVLLKELDREILTMDRLIYEFKQRYPGNYEIKRIYDSQNYFLEDIGLDFINDEEAIQWHLRWL